VPTASASASRDRAANPATLARPIGVDIEMPAPHALAAHDPHTPRRSSWARTEPALDLPPDDPVSQVLGEWLRSRPTPGSIAQDDGRDIVRSYLPAGDDEGRTSHHERFYSGKAGVAMLVLPVHPEAAAIALTPPGPGTEAERIKQALHAPPVGLLMGVWPVQGGAIQLHNNLVHEMQDSGAPGPTPWQVLPTPASDAPNRLQMLGRQGDGSVAVRQGAALLLFGSVGEPPSVVDISQLAHCDMVRLGAGGTCFGVVKAGPAGPARIVQGQIESMGTTQQAVPKALAPLALLQPDPDAGPLAWRETATPVSDMVALGTPEHPVVLVSDEKGRLYAGQGPWLESCSLQALAVPNVMGPAEHWAAKGLGLSDDGAAWVSMESRAGHTVLARWDTGSATLRPEYNADMPLMLMRSSGLAAATPIEGTQVSLDGHASLALGEDGVLCFRESEHRPWRELQDSQHQALTKVCQLQVGPFGFVDRKKIHALQRDEHGGLQRIVAVSLSGRTTVLPASQGARHPADRPLAVVPAQTELDSRQTLLELRADHPVRIAGFAVDKAGAAHVLDEASGRLFKADPNNPGSLVPLLGGDAPAGATSIALGADDRIHALAPHEGGWALYTHAPPDRARSEPPRWQAVPLQLPGLAASTPEPPAEDRAVPITPKLKASRLGVLQIEMPGPDGRPSGVRHALLPPMTQPGGGLGQWEVDPLPVQPQPADGIDAGTNLSINRQGPTRLRLTRNHDLHITTTAMGQTSTDAFGSGGQLSTVRAGLAADHVRNAVQGAFKTAAQLITGGPAPHGLTGTWVAPLLADVQACHARFLQTFGPGAAPAGAPAQVHASEAAGRARAFELEQLLVSLQRIGILSNTIDPSMATSDAAFGSNTASYGAAEAWRATRSTLKQGVRWLTGNEQTDLVAPLARYVQGQADAEVPGRTDREKRLLESLTHVLGALQTAGVHLPLLQGAPGHASVDTGDPFALHTNSAAQAAAAFAALQALPPDATDAQVAAATPDAASPVRKLSRLGMASWSQLGAFSDVVTEFRREMDNPGSARRRQFLNSLGLPREASTRQIAVRLHEALQELYNRSTFFSNSSGGLSAGLTGFLAAPWSVSPSLGVEFIHALGVERIGDSKEGDAGLVAFFVKHDRARVATNAAFAIDLKRGPGGVKTEQTAVSHEHETVSHKIDASVGTGVTATFQHGQGAAVLIHPQDIQEFARCLLDIHDDDATNLLQRGWNGGAIGLDLFETSLAGTATGAGAASFGSSETAFNRLPLPPKASRPVPPGQPPGPSSSPGAAGPEPSGQGSYGRPPGAGGYGEPPRPGAYALPGAVGAEGPAAGRAASGAGSRSRKLRQAPPAGDAPPAAKAERAAKASYGLTAGVNANIGMRWHEMELHLSHLWGEFANQNFGLENQGSFAFTADATAQLRAGGSMGGTFQVPGKENPAVNAGLGNLQLAALVARDPALIQSARLTAGTYKRTLDATVAEPVQDKQWKALTAQLERDFPGQVTVAPLPEASAQRLALIANVWNNVQGLVGPDQKLKADALDQLRRLHQQEEASIIGGATVMPGARIELNLMGRRALNELPGHVLAHLGLAGTMDQVRLATEAVPGMKESLQALQNLASTAQIRFVFEMRPAAMAQINDGLRQRLRAQKGLPVEAPDAQTRWHDVVQDAVNRPDLYRLAAIATHNTDDNPSSFSVGLLGLTGTRSATASKQLFQAEMQMLYGPGDALVGVELLESAGRVVDAALDPLRQGSLMPLQLARLRRGEGVFGPPSPRTDRAVPATSVLPPAAARDEPGLHRQGMESRDIDTGDEEFFSADESLSDVESDDDVFFSAEDSDDDVDPAYRDLGAAGESRTDGELSSGSLAAPEMTETTR
jgi:hypothetical protein